MEEFVNFLSQYKEVIVGCFCFLLTLLCVLIKRRPKTIDDFLYSLDEVIVQLPYAIIDVERPGFGAKKKDEVLEWALSRVSSKLGRQLVATEISYAKNKISTSIENILSTPSKKGI